MKLQVQRYDGDTETINLEGKWTVQEGEYLNRLVSNQGMEHFFTIEGFYDGWGSAVCSPDMSEAIEQIMAMEEKRQIQRKNNE